MDISRRDLSRLLPALAAAGAAAQQGQERMLSSKVYQQEEIPYSGDDRKKGRRFFYHATHSGFSLEMHETILGPGKETHAPHKHEHEEIVLVVEGTVEAYIEGRKEVVHPGSVIYFGSNEMHSARNVGTTPSKYYIIELRGEES
jgi:XRE family transcriptional regulator, regulator of sulfur utilization